VQAGDGVLELGCSYGVCSRMLQEHGAWLVGVDNSEACVRQVRVCVCVWVGFWGKGWGWGVLELGCSYGVCSRMLQEHGAWLVGVDNSEACVRQVCVWVGVGVLGWWLGKRGRRCVCSRMLQEHEAWLVGVDNSEACV
jgi:SAM-dependent methyltransferase